jgi:hypothetical protein
VGRSRRPGKAGPRAWTPLIVVVIALAGVLLVAKAFVGAALATPPAVYHIDTPSVVPGPRVAPDLPSVPTTADPSLPACPSDPGSQSSIAAPASCPFDASNPCPPLTDGCPGSTATGGCSADAPDDCSGVSADCGGGDTCAGAAIPDRARKAGVF